LGGVHFAFVFSLRGRARRIHRNFDNDSRPSRPVNSREVAVSSRRGPPRPHEKRTNSSKVALTRPRPVAVWTSGPGRDRAPVGGRSSRGRARALPGAGPLYWGKGSRCRPSSATRCCVAALRDRGGPMFVARGPRHQLDRRRTMSGRLRGAKTKEEGSAASAHASQTSEESGTLFRHTSNVFAGD